MVGEENNYPQIDKYNALKFLALRYTKVMDWNIGEGKKAAFCGCWSDNNDSTKEHKMMGLWYVFIMFGLGVPHVCCSAQIPGYLIE